MTLTRLVARPMLASMFVVGGLNALRNAPKLAAKAEPVTDTITGLADKVAPEAPIPHDPTTLVRINGAVQVGAGLLLATGHVPRLSSAALAATLVPTTVAGHRFWEERDPAAKAQPVTDTITGLADKVAPEAPIPHDPTTLVRINGAVQVGAGLLLATGHVPRLSSAALAATLVPTTVAGHRFWEERDPAAKAQ